MNQQSCDSEGLGHPTCNMKLQFQDFKQKV
jgi:hypothetical protein